MQLKTKLLLLAALFVLALPLILTGTASAKYMGDGAVQDGVTGGWIIPNDMVCIVGVHADGTLDIADGVTNRRNCIYYTTGLTGMNPIDVTATSTCGAAGTSACNVSSNCTGSNPVALGTLTWNATDLKCYNSAPCTVAGYAGNDGAKHALATSICVDGSGNGTSLADVDRTYSMCVAKGGTWKQTSATAPYPGASGTFPTPNFGGACIAYGAQFKGQDADGTPLAFGTEGTTQAAGTGFCYAKMRTGIAVASCPSVVGSANGTKTATSVAAFGYAATSTQCTYDYGINGAIDAALTKYDGTTYAAGTVLNLSAFTTTGDCLANGGSWANWIPMGTSAAIGSITGVTFDLTRQAVNADEGCLHCHSSLTQYNGPEERWKDSYLKTGHKNMLRKVTAGKNWAGPDADGVISVYTSAATGTINFGTLGNNDATAQISGVDKPLLYLFGDWMALAPDGLDVVVNMSGAAKYNGSSDYSCAACHTAGWSNTDSTKGLCTLSSKTTSAACTGAGGVWTPLSGVQAIGTPGYTATQPGDSFPGITFGTAGQWDLEGITCGRCHNATVPSVVAAQIAASSFPATAPTGGGMGALAAGVLRNSLCFGCHQSMAKTSNGSGADADLANPTNLIVKNSVTTGSCSVAGKTSESTCQSASGIWTPTSYIPMFSGHVIGNSFLNSPHARFTGTVVPNSLGKYDLAANTAANYNSAFKGFTCWQTPTSTSPAITKADGTEIKTKTECESLYGTGSWRADTGTPGAADSIQGTCTTCHDVHQSLFVEGQEGLRKECDNCHDNSDYAAAVSVTPQIDPAVIAHPKSADTPFDTSQYSNACEVCHMPKPTSGDFPMHVWRINPDASYSTFPTAAEYGAGTSPTKKIANSAADGTYANAVWVDLDLACGQCHGPAGPAVHQFSKTALSTFAEVMHDGGVAPTTNCTTCHTKNIATMNHPVSTGTPATCITCHTKPGTSINIDASCGACHGGSAGQSATQNGAPYISKSLLLTYAENIHLNAAPKASFTSNMSLYTVTLTDTSTDDSIFPDNAITVKWGDGKSETGDAGSVFTHIYETASKFNIVYTVTDSNGLRSSKTKTVAVKFSITANISPALTTNAKFILKKNGIVIRTGTGTDSYVFSGLRPGTYKVKMKKLGYTFDGDGVTVGNQNPITVIIGTSDETVTFTHTP